MQYFIAFLEGIITFISPCLLPMLPVYVSYFAGGGERSAGKTLKNALGFTAGFTLVFALMGALAGTLGGFLAQYRVAVQIVTGLVVVLFGLHFLGVFQLGVFRGVSRPAARRNPGFFSSLLFGLVFSVGWTPCVGAFLGSALALAGTSGTAVKGVLLLVTYSLGLGAPFLLSALLIEKLNTAFTFIKKHYRVINIVCGCFLILVGILMACGLMDAITAVFS